MKNMCMHRMNGSIYHFICTTFIQIPNHHSMTDTRKFTINQHGKLAVCIGQLVKVVALPLTFLGIPLQHLPAGEPSQLFLPPLYELSSVSWSSLMAGWVESANNINKIIIYMLQKCTILEQKQKNFF